MSAVLACATAVAIGCAAPPDLCTERADSAVARGWELFRGGRIRKATGVFERTLRQCPDHVGAAVGSGYGYLRQDRLDDARHRFELALSLAPLTVDALQGLGIIAWRAGEDAEARRRFTAVLELTPDNAEAWEFLDQLGMPPVRAPLVLPDSLELVSRTRSGRFETLDGGAWHPFYIKGVNLGAALPGRFPSEFPDSATYAEWIAQMAEMGANAIRVYTIHPPYFYQALAEHNRARPSAPLWLIHGVWAELPPRHDFDDAAWNAEFTAEMHRVVDLVHGRADLSRRPGHASGFYTADVSAWTLAYILGREWEPFAVDTFDRAHPERTAWRGTYMAIAGGTAMDVWLVQAMDRIVAYESKTYRHQRPVAYTSWPTLDPLHHETEATVAEELALRASLGGDTTPRPKEYDNDLVAIDPNLVTPTASFEAGTFASYHAYPYYPDFMVVGGGYARYLRGLREHHGDLPVVIAEYGVPASLGIAHLADSGWHHGGHTEAAQARIDADLTALIAAEGMAGGIVFAWIDEWFKHNWVVIDLELPRDRTRAWLSRLNAEEQYGMVAMEPLPRLQGATLADRRTAWSEVGQVLYEPVLRAAVDEAYLHLLFEPGTRGRPDTLLVGLDIADPKTGSFRWPGGGGRALPVGVEFAVIASRDGVRVVADPAANPFSIARVPILRSPEVLPPVTRLPAGAFFGP
ncbi:MAG: tetratricopeptide repeat protein, partial [Gemmatimonadales bacterium]|nr:tetratricopeptide repeat protein [Gemmatimonadales bacterium]